jgi:excisionase family DNA binding protein
MTAQVHVRPVYTVATFCEDFGVKKSTTYAEIREGRLRAFKVGDRTMIAGEDALAWRDRYRSEGYRKAAYPAAPLAA